MIAFTAGLSLALLPFISAQPSKRWANDSSILNGSYVNPQFKQSQTNVWGYAVESFEYLLNGTDFPTGWVGQNGWTNVAQWDLQEKTRGFYDHYNQNETYYAYHPTGCYSYWHNPLADCYNDDAGWAALSSLEGYEAYGDPKFLAWAESVFEFVTGHGFIHDSDLEAGYLVDTKWPNTTLQATCNGESMYGGVYWMNGVPRGSNTGWSGQGDPDVNAVSSGLYALLGAELCRVTGDQTYCEIAYRSMQWIDRFLVEPSGLVYDHINGSSCVVTNWTFTYNAGLYIGAYGILGAITNNDTASQLAQRTAIASMNTPVWNDAQGVIFEGAGNVTASDDGIGFKSVLIRNLHRISQWVDQDLQDAIRQYVNIQYWSLVNYDSNDAMHPVQYGRNWTGTFETATGQDMVATLDVLNALTLNPQTAFPQTGATNVAVISID